MTETTYAFRWLDSGPGVEIQDGEGLPKRMNEAALIQVVRRIRGSRRQFASEAAWKRELGIYEGALRYLRVQMDIERR